MSASELVARVGSAWRGLGEARAIGTFSEQWKGGGQLKVSDSEFLPDREGCPELVRNAIQEDVARIIGGEWACLHGHQLTVPMPPDWHCDYLAGQSFWEDCPARCFNHRALQRGGDVRLIWEVNRWLPLVRLGQAAYLFGDGASARLVVALLDDWATRNPLGRGVNWTSAMESGIRLINLRWFHALMADVALNDDERSKFESRVRELALSHTWWVSRHLSVGSSANNHLLGELAGLIVALEAWPELASWALPIGKLAERFEAEVLSQFHSDGGNCEQAMHYHLFAFELCWHAVSALRRGKIALRGEVIDRLSAAAGFLIRVGHSGEAWDYGDSDDAQVVPLTQGVSTAVEEWLGWFSRNDSEERSLDFWLGEAPRCSTLGREVAGWDHFPESGMVVRSSDQWKARFDVSALGLPPLGAHGHLDALHLSLWHNANAVIIDPGTGGYYGSPEERTFLASWEAHNGPHLVSGGFPKRNGTFLWGPFHNTPSFGTWEHGVFGQLRLPSARFQRRVRCGIEDGSENEDGWEIIDEAACDDGQWWEVCWCLAPQWSCQEVKKGLICATFGSDEVWLSVKAEEVRLVDREATNGVGLGLCSPFYGRFLKTSVISIRSRRAAMITRIWASMSVTA